MLHKIPLCSHTQGSETTRRRSEQHVVLHKMLQRRCLILLQNPMQCYTYEQQTRANWRILQTPFIYLRQKVIFSPPSLCPSSVCLSVCSWPEYLKNYWTKSYEVWGANYSRLKCSQVDFGQGQIKGQVRNKQLFELFQCITLKQLDDSYEIW